MGYSGGGGTACQVCVAGEETLWELCVCVGSNCSPIQPGMGNVRCGVGEVPSVGVGKSTGNVVGRWEGWGRMVGGVGR